MVLFSIIFTSKVGDNSRHVVTAWSIFLGRSGSRDFFWRGGTVLFDCF